MKTNIYKIRLIIAVIVGILSISAIFGWFYPVKILDLQFIALLQRALTDFSIAALILLTLVIVCTLFFGRIYCSTICPFGILQELVSLLRKKYSQQKNYKLKYLLASLGFGCLLGGSAIIVRCFEPYSVFGNAFTLGILGIVFLSAILFLVFYKNRFFCTNICPVGAVLGLISKISFAKIHFDKEYCVSCGKCARNCQAGCIDVKEKTVDNEICVKCLKCLSVCPKGAIKYSKDFGEKIKFNPKRREFLWGISSLAVLSAAYAIGLNFSKNIAKKVKDIILPAGAENSNKMANKCLNCNLCVQNCPTKILSKANSEFPVVHIDYEKGSGFCDYECNKCSQVCPSGAIKKITLDEKQHTRIAMANISYECTGCGHCSHVCPVGAISVKHHESASVDGTKCIGCGACKNVCPVDAINIYGINKQSNV